MGPMILEAWHRITKADTAPSSTLNSSQNGDCVVHIAHHLPATQRESFLESRMWGSCESVFSRNAGLKSRSWNDVELRRRASLEAWKC